VEALCGVRCDSAEDVGEPGLWIDVVEFGGLQESVDGGGAFGSAIRASLIMPGVWGSNWKCLTHSIPYSGRSLSLLRTNSTTASGT
jgi:hypothetical protein